MKDKKLQVFVSSTFTDLIEERQAAVEAILSSGNIPAGMELFSAGDETQMKVIERWIDESDVYMLILGGRYGSIEPKSGKSYTHLEYEYAIEKNKPLFAVVLNENFINKKIKKLKKGAIEQENHHKLTEFKELVMSKIIKPCDDNKDIKLAIHETLSDFNYRKELVGWIRGDKGVDSPLLAEEIARLTKENDELRKNSNLKNEFLYNGLIYQDLKKILEQEESSEDELHTRVDNLFYYLFYIGDSIVRPYYPRSNESRYNFRKLSNFKIVEYNSETNYYSFTEDGHKFYLRTLLDEEI